MSRTALPTAYLRRIAHILAQHGQAGDESAGKAAAWLTEALEAQQCPSQAFRDKVNSLRVEWERFASFDAAEEHHFRANEPDLRDLRAEDWELMRDFLAYTPRDGENFFQVQKRQTFLQCPEDTLGAAIRWQKTHRRKAYTPPKKKDESTHSDTELDALLTDIFKDAVWNQPDERKAG